MKESVALLMTLINRGKGHLRLDDRNDTHLSTRSEIVHSTEPRRGMNQRHIRSASSTLRLARFCSMRTIIYSRPIPKLAMNQESGSKLVSAFSISARYSYLKKYSK